MTFEPCRTPPGENLETEDHLQEAEEHLQELEKRLRLDKAKELQVDKRRYFAI